MRDWLCPVNRRWPLAVLLGALARDYPRRPNGAASRHFVLIEYVMLSGVNDTLDDAHRSAARRCDATCQACPKHAVPAPPYFVIKVAVRWLIE